MNIVKNNESHAKGMEGTFLPQTPRTPSQKQLLFTFIDVLSAFTSLFVFVDLLLNVDCFVL